jgi:hypothetical protein
MDPPCLLLRFNAKILAAPKKKEGEERAEPSKVKNSSPQLAYLEPFQAVKDLDRRR